MTPLDGATFAAFLACVALAAGVQNLTGFAFGLVLLGTLALLDAVPVADAANAASVLTLVNAASFFRLHRLQPGWRVIQPAILPSVMGVAAGVALLAWLSANAVQWLRCLLGLAILACAFTLLFNLRQRETVSSRPVFAVVGAISGLMGGMFSSAGPPLVYHLYRQPLQADMVRQCLVLVFAINQVVRLALVVVSGHFSGYAALLSVSAIPVVHAVGWLQKRYMPPLGPLLVRRAVCGLLVLAGSSLLVMSAGLLRA